MDNRNYYVWVVYIACHDFNFNIFGSKTTNSKHTFGCPTIKHSTSVLFFCSFWNTACTNIISVEQLLIQSNKFLIHRGVHHYSVKIIWISRLHIQVSNLKLVCNFFVIFVVYIWQKCLFKNSSFSPPPWSISEAWLDALFSSSRFLFILFVLRIM